MTKNETTNWRITQLELGYKDLSVKLDRIVEVEFPKFREDISSLKTRINLLTAINVGALVLAIILNKYL